MLIKENWMEIIQLYEQGISISEIARRLKADMKTIRRYAKNLNQPSYQKRPEIQPLLDRYKDYLKQRLEQYDL